MQEMLYYIRDHLVGTHYFLYAFILFFFMFAIIGYLFKEKYGKYEIKLKTSQDNVKKESNVSKNVVTTPKKELKNAEKNSKKIVEPQKPINVVVSKPQVVKTNTPVAPAPKPAPMPSPIKPQTVNPTPMPNVGTKANPTPIPNTNTATKTVQNGPIPEL